jgi:hypothetical protein
MQLSRAATLIIPAKGGWPARPEKYEDLMKIEKMGHFGPSQVPLFGKFRRRAFASTFFFCFAIII